MGIGIFNPKDSTRSIATRPTVTPTGEGIWKWYTDSLKTRPKGQDLNAWIAQFRTAVTYWAVVDEETDVDNMLTKAILAAITDNEIGPPLTVASAATTNIGALRSTRIDISGNTTITSFGNVPGKLRFVRFTGTGLTLTNGTALALPGGRNIQTLIGDQCIAASDAAGNWMVLAYAAAADQQFGIPHATLTASATVDIATQNAFYIAISGSGAVSSLGAGKNRFKILRLSAGVQLTNGANLIVPGGNYIAADGDIALAWSDNNAVWRVALSPVNPITGLLSADGAGSGLDADLLDGQHGAYYRDLTNATGTLDDARLPANAALPGAPTTTTATPGTSTTQIATCAFVQSSLGAAGAASTLTGLSDVSITSVANGQLFKWQSTVSKWVNSVSIIDGATGQRVALSDVSLSLGGTAAADIYDIAKRTDDGLLRLSGGISAAGLGAIVVLRGPTAANAGRGLLQTNGVACLRWDPTFNLDSLVAHGFIDGTAAAPGITFSVDTDNGLRRIGANSWALVAAGADVAALSAAAWDFKVAPTVLGVAIPPLASPSFTGTVTANSFMADRTGLSGATTITVAGDAGTLRSVVFMTGSSSNRWQLRCDNAAEGSGDAGSNFVMLAFDNSGASLGQVFNVTRATRTLNFVVSPTAPTPAVGDSSTLISTTAFVSSAIAAPTFTGAIHLRSYTKATLPSASPAGGFVWCSNATGGAIPAYSDGTNWLRVDTSAIV